MAFCGFSVGRRNVKQVEQRAGGFVVPAALAGFPEGDDRLVEQLANDPGAECADDLAVAFRQVPEAAQCALQLGLAHLLGSLLQRPDSRSCLADSQPGGELIDSLFDQRVDAAHLAVVLSAGGAGDLFEIIDRSEIDERMGIEGGVDRARNAEIDDQQWLVAPVDRRRQRGRPEDVTGRLDGRENDGRVGQLVGQRIERPVAAFDCGSQRLSALGRAIDDHQVGGIGRAKDAGSDGADLTRAEDDDAAAGQRSDLPGGKVDRGV